MVYNTDLVNLSELNSSKENYYKASEMLQAIMINCIPSVVCFDNTISYKN